MSNQRIRLRSAPVGERKEGARIASLDGWRGVAIGLVLIGHFFTVPGINLAFLGVELFFVLSGRLMADILFVRKFPLPEFFYRRATRILPALIVFVLIAFTAAQFVGPSFSPFWLVTAITFSINYVTVLVQYPSESMQQLWSLCIEEHAYVLLGIVVLAFGRGRVKPVAAIAVLAIASMLDGATSVWLLGQNVYTAYWRTDAHVASIFVSVVIFLIVRHRIDPAWIKNSGLPVMLAALVGGILFSIDAAPVPLRYTVGTTMLALAVALVDAAGPAVRKALSFRPLTALGVLSYSIYLWQEPVYHLADDGVAPTWVMLPIAIGIGAVSFYVVEQPSRRALNNLWKRRQRSSADTSVTPTTKPASAI